MHNFNFVPFGSTFYCCRKTIPVDVRDRIRFSNFSGSGSGFSPDSGTKKIAERSLKLIRRKLKIYDKGPSKNEKGNNFLLKLIIK